MVSHCVFFQALSILRGRLVEAERFSRHKITVGLIGSGPASATYAAKLANTAFAFELVGVTKFLQVWRVPPNIGKRLPGDITAV